VSESAIAEKNKWISF